MDKVVCFGIFLTEQRIPYNTGKRDEIYAFTPGKRNKLRFKCRWPQNLTMKHSR